MCRRHYGDKKVSLNEALAMIKTGDYIFIGSACGDPQYLVQGLVEKASCLADNKILHLHALGVAPYAKPVYSARFRLHTFFVGINTREAVVKEELTTRQSFSRNCRISYLRAWFQ